MLIIDMNKDKFTLECLGNGIIKVDNGNVYRCATWCGRHPRKDITPIKVGHKDSKGYLVFKIRGYVLRIHRTVWISHHGLIPEGLCINHKNGIKTDNNIENLELVTPKENSEHAVSLGKYSTGEHRPNHLLTENQAKDIFLHCPHHRVDMKKYAEKYNVKWRTILALVYGYSWKYLTDGLR